MEYLNVCTEVTSSIRVRYLSLPNALECVGGRIIEAADCKVLPFLHDQPALRSCEKLVCSLIRMLIYAHFYLTKQVRSTGRFFIAVSANMCIVLQYRGHIYAKQFYRY